ncbi:osmoprotectant transporter activator [Zoogloea oleivorans]|jgi:ProP effector|uniref:Osmoprotectant transporter activator n=1 Tax=Zoogloea oleivorans TaxID=1552750 RepID=A0A6C2CM65_9RHOO|nr:ProQ/FinO family protein [Zoogloea oleivorans]MBT9496858.1 ProQ/FinO family protein [Zoogloea sp.]TYC54353.1 osmoprotectant transporter activator [Zoogloea oleivorans]
MVESDKSVAPAQTAKGLLSELQGAFPVFHDFLPLAIGIDKQLLLLRPDISKKVLRSTLGMHTRSVPYLKVLQNAATRFNLDGSPADAVSAEHKALAAQTLREHFKQLAAKRKEKEAEKQAAAAAEAAERERAEKLTKLSEKFSRR